MSLAKELAKLANEVNSPKFMDYHKLEFEKLAREQAEKGEAYVAIGRFQKKDLFQALISADGQSYLRSEEFIIEMPGDLVCYFNKEGQWPVETAPATEQPASEPAAPETVVETPATNAGTQAPIAEEPIIETAPITNIPANAVDIPLNTGDVVVVNNQTVIVTNVLGDGTIQVEPAPADQGSNLPPIEISVEEPSASVDQPVTNAPVSNQPAIDPVTNSVVNAPITNIPATNLDIEVEVGEPVVVNNVPSIVTEVNDDGSIVVEPIPEDQIDTVIEETEDVSSVEDLPVITVPVTDLEATGPVSNNATDLSGGELASEESEEGDDESESDVSDSESLEGVEVELPSDDEIPATSDAEDPVVSPEEDTIETPISIDEETAPVNGARAKLKDRRRK